MAEVMSDHEQLEVALALIDAATIKASDAELIIGLKGWLRRLVADREGGNAKVPREWEPTVAKVPRFNPVHPGEE